MNIQTIEVASHWVFEGRVWRYTEDQKLELDKAWSRIELANDEGVLRGLQYYLVIEPVVRNILLSYTNLDCSEVGGGWDTAYDHFARCVCSGKAPSWKQVGTATKYRVGSTLCDTKEQAVVASIQCGDVTPELLIELAGWLKEEN